MIGAARGRRWQRALALNLGLLASGAATDSLALAIQIQYATPGTASRFDRNLRFTTAGTLTGGGSFEGVVEAAVDTWESLLLDPFTFRVTFGWADLPGRVLAMGQSSGPGGFGEVIFNRGLSHYADPTPYQHEEFLDYAEAVAGLGGGEINVRRGFRSSTTPLVGRLASFDMLTTMLHELGHVLGTPGDLANLDTDELSVKLGEFAGSRLPCVGLSFCSHLALRSALMSADSGSFDHTRTLISGADLLYVASDGFFSNIDATAVRGATVPLPGSLGLALAALTGLACARRSRPRSCPQLQLIEESS